MHQSPGAGPRFRQGTKCKGDEVKQYSKHEQYNPIQKGQVLDKDEVKQSYQHPSQYGTSNGGDQEDFDTLDAAI